MLNLREKSLIQKSIDAEIVREKIGWTDEAREASIEARRKDAIISEFKTKASALIKSEEYARTGIGVRFVDDAPAVGSILPPSRIWVDNIPTDEDLDGTSVVDLRAPDKIMNSYMGKFVILVGGEYGGSGEDEYENIIKYAKVLAIEKIQD